MLYVCWLPSMQDGTAAVQPTGLLDTLVCVPLNGLGKAGHGLSVDRTNQERIVNVRIKIQSNLSKATTCWLTEVVVINR